VDEVLPAPVNQRGVVVEGVQAGFDRAPVEVVDPVVNQLAQVAQLSTVTPLRVVELAREARALETLAEIVENRLVYVGLESFNVHGSAFHGVA